MKPLYALVIALCLYGCARHSEPPRYITLPNYLPAPPTCTAEDGTKMNGAVGVTIDRREIILTDPWLRDHTKGGHFGFSCYGPKQTGDLEVMYHE